MTAAAGVSAGKAEAIDKLAAAQRAVEAAREARDAARTAAESAKAVSAIKSQAIQTVMGLEKIMAQAEASSKTEPPARPKQ